MQGYKGFKQIYQQANRRLEQRKQELNEPGKTEPAMKKQTPDNSTSLIKKFASFLARYESLDGYTEDAHVSSEFGITLDTRFNENAFGPVKQVFKKLGEKALKELGTYLALKDPKVSFNPGGPAVSGDLMLSGMIAPGKGVRFRFNKDDNRHMVLYHSIKDMKDNTGGTNYFMHESDFSQPEKVKEKVYNLLDIDLAMRVKSLNDLNQLPNVGVYRIPKHHSVESHSAQTREPESSNTETNSMKNVALKENETAKETNEVRKKRFEISLKTALEKGDKVEAATVIRELLFEIMVGYHMELTPDLVLAFNENKLSRELREAGLSSIYHNLINDADFRQYLSINLWELIPVEYKTHHTIEPLQWKAEPDDKGLENLLKPFFSRDALRPSLMTANFDQHGIVATDANMLLFLNERYRGKKGLYCMNKFCFGSTNNKTNPVKIIQHYPNYLSVTPDKSRLVLTQDLHILHMYCRALLDAGFVGEKHLAAFIFEENNILTLDLKMLLSCVETFLKLGYDTADFGIEAANKAILITPVGDNELACKQATPYIILMPAFGTFAKVKELEKGQILFDLDAQTVQTTGVAGKISLKDSMNKDDVKGTTIPPSKKPARTIGDDSPEPLDDYIGENAISDKEYAWEMKQLDFLQVKAIERSGSPNLVDLKDKALHEKLVKQALMSGKTVPKEVVREYPYLTHYDYEKDQKQKAKEARLAKAASSTATTDSVKTQSPSLLSAGEWFKQHPEKVLGEAFETTNPFGKKVTKIKGKAENILNGINAPAVTASDDSEAITETQINRAPTRPIEQLMNDPDKKNNIERVLNQTKKDFSEKALRKLKGEIVSEASDGTFSFDDILQQYNQGISEDEIKAWIWYKRKTGGFNDENVILKKQNGWSKFVIPLAEISRYTESWMRQGIICYYEGGFIPSVLYYAENIYERQSALLNEKNDIIANYGQEQFDRQWQGLEKIKPLKLTLNDPVQENRLFIKPDSKFAEEIMVKELSDGTQLSTYSAKQKGFVKSSVTLVEAFISWLNAQPKNDFKKSTQYDIVHYYLKGSSPSKRYEKAEKIRLKQNAKTEGDAFFVRFLADALTREDQLRIEQLWNSRYNGYVEINYFKVPVAFTCSSTFKNKPLFIRNVQREGIGFINAQGSGCIAYDVGLGKTMTGILALAQAMEMGQCKRPMIVVPNQTYKNWLSEIQGVVDQGKITLTGLLPQYQVIDLYNLGTDYLEPLRDDKGQLRKVPEYSISVMTYEGFNRLSFDDETWKEIGDELYSILNQGIDKKRDQQKLSERIDEMIGKGIKGGMADIEDLGFDYAIVDEAHAMKKSFTQVKGEIKGEEGDREKGTYEIRSGEPSMTALRGFMISQYILRHNKMRNVLLLTATPFTNSPLEIYSILALIGYQQLEKWGIKNIKEFFDTFIKTSNELIINAKLKPERKEIVMGFHNLIALQQLIYKFIHYKTGEDAKIQRPNKIVLPLLNRKEGERIIALPPEEQISTNLQLTAEQKRYMADVEAYVMGDVSLENFCINPHGYEDNETDSEGGGGEILDDKKLSSDEEDGARILRGMSFARQLALSPYLYACNPNHNPTFTQYIESSPKLQYVMECIRTVKVYHEERQEDVSGQVIYMNAGVHFFPLIKEYLVKRIGYSEDEVGIIRSGMAAAKKEGIKERFLAGAVKIIIGSASIKEGINLQTRSTVLYNCWMDWNPTDVKQLEGRIWRFGNIFANIRIVNPLMEDSIDTFIFQKLEEKTSRINEIWFRAGKSNTLNLEEFNPAELKMGLITDPRALAQLILMGEREKLMDEITGIENQKKVLTDIADQREVFEKSMLHVNAVVQKYKPVKEPGQNRSTETTFKIFRDYLSDEDVEHTYEDEERFDSARKAYAFIKRGVEQILEPRGLNIHFSVKKLTEDMDKDIERIRKIKEDKTGTKAIEAQAQKIIADRIKRGYKPKTVMERVAEFANLNPKLLSELMVYDNSDQAKESKAEQIKKGQTLENTGDRLAQVIELREAFKRMKERKEMLSVLKGAA